MAKRPCARPGCGELVVSGYCARHQASSPRALNEARRGSAAERGYDGKWQRYSRRRLQAYPLCEGLRVEPEGPVRVNTHPGVVRAATLTDHIRPHRGDKRLFWEAANHQSGCAECHNVKTVKFDGGFGRAGARG